MAEVVFFLVSIRTVSEPIFLPFPNPRFQPSVVGSFTNWKLRELSANFAPNVSVISRRTRTSMGAVDDESRTRTNCSFVREKEISSWKRRGNSARAKSNLLPPEIAFCENSDSTKLGGDRAISGKINERGRPRFS